jgi:hypothetical protein
LPPQITPPSTSHQLTDYVGLGHAHDALLDDQH